MHISTYGILCQFLGHLILSASIRFSIGKKVETQNEANMISFDALTLVQRSTDLQWKVSTNVASGLMQSRFDAIAGFANGQAHSSKFYNCTRHPTLCKDPINCHQPRNKADKEFNKLFPATADGHSNLKTWCFAKQYESNLVQECLVNRDLKKSAQQVFRDTVAHGIGELDGSYCFIEGHCTNTAVNYNTSVQEAESMCDQRFGHDGWAKFSYVEFYATKKALKSTMDPRTGFHHPVLTKNFLRLACAMGNYHCDVIYCRDTYCKLPYYINKYSHLLPKTPGHLIQERV